MYLNKIFLSILLCVTTVGLAVEQPLPTRMEKPSKRKPYPAVYPPLIPEAVVLTERLQNGGLSGDLIERTALIATLTTTPRPRGGDVSAIFDEAFYAYQTVLDGRTEMSSEERLWALQKERNKKRALVELTLADEPLAAALALRGMHPNE